MAAHASTIAFATTAAGGAVIAIGIPEYAPLVAVAGVAGSLVCTLTKRESWREAIRTMLIGTVSAPFLWPIAGPLFEQGIGVRFEMTLTDARMLGGFAIGFCGAAALRLVNTFFRVRGRLLNGDRE